jgi:hypothetical protein
MCGIQVEANKTAAAAEALGVRALAIQADTADPEANYYISTEVKTKTIKMVSKGC